MMMRGVEKQHSGAMTSAMLRCVPRAQEDARRIPGAGESPGNQF